MRHRETQFPARTTRAGAPAKNGRLRRAVARKAEDEAHLRFARKAIPSLLRQSRARAGPHWLESDDYARAPLGQRCVSRGPCQLAFAGAPVGHARSRARQWTQGEHSELYGEDR